MAAPKQTTKQRIALLEAENLRLRSEVDRLKGKGSGQSVGTRFKWRSVLIVALLSLAGAMLVVGNILFWAGRTITETDRYVETISPVIEQPEVQQAIAQKTTEVLFNQVNVEEIAVEALPQRAEFLAPSLAQQVRTFADQQAEKIVASSEFQDTWVKVNTAAHQRLLTFVRNYDGDGTIDVSDIYSQLASRLEGGRLSFLAGKQLPPRIGAITVVDAPNLPKVHWIVVNLSWIRYATILLFVLLSSLVIWLSDNKRRVALRMGVLYAALMLVTLIAIRIGRTVAVDKVDPEFQAAASVIWQTILHSFVLQTLALLLVAVIMVMIAWLGGQGSAQVKIRSRVSQLLNGKLHQAIFGNKENTFTRFMLKYKRVIQWLFVALAFVSLLFIKLRPVAVLLAGLVTLLLTLVVEVLAATRK